MFCLRPSPMIFVLDQALCVLWGTKPNVLFVWTSPMFFLFGTKPYVFVVGTKPYVFVVGTKPYVCLWAKPYLFFGTKPIFCWETKPHVLSAMSCWGPSPMLLFFVWGQAHFLGPSPMFCLDQAHVFFVGTKHNVCFAHWFCGAKPNVFDQCFYSVSGSSQTLEEHVLIRWQVIM